MGSTGSPSRLLARSAALVAALLVALTAAILPAGSASADVSTSAGYYAIVTWQTGLCVDGSVTQGVKLKSCNGSAFQQWLISGGKFKSRQYDNLCLDASVSQGVQLKTCNNGDYQQWD